MWVYPVSYTHLDVYKRQVIYSEGAIPELQVWDWEGKLKKRFLFDKIYDNFTVSPDGRLYALNTQEPYKIYTYEVGK